MNVFIIYVHIIYTYGTFSFVALSRSRPFRPQPLPLYYCLCSKVGPFQLPLLPCN